MDHRQALVFVVGVLAIPFGMILFAVVIFRAGRRLDRHRTVQSFWIGATAGTAAGVIAGAVDARYGGGPLEAFLFFLLAYLLGQAVAFTVTALRSPRLPPSAESVRPSSGLDRPSDTSSST